MAEERAHLTSEAEGLCSAPSGPEAGGEPFELGSTSRLSPAGFWKSLLHGFPGRLGLPSPGSSLSWEDPGDIMDDPLTRRKLSEAVQLSVLGTVFPKPAVEPGAGGTVPNST